MKHFMGLLILLGPVIAVASGAEHGSAHHDIEIPKSVIYQAINVGILVVGLVYLLKDDMVTFFKVRQETYLQAAQRAAFAREQAEREFQDLKNKIAELEKTRELQLQKAKAHADEITSQIATEANQVTMRIKSEAELTARLEIQRAQRDLRNQLLTDSVAAAHTVLSKDIGSADHLKLQNEFINHIEVVR